MLAAKDRDFFGLVSEAAFANPFGDDRERLDRRIAGGPRGAGREELSARLLATVRERLTKVDGREVDLRRHGDADRALLEHAVLFDLFHRYADAFDVHIRKQLTRAGAPLRVDFAREALGALGRAGFEAAEAGRYFAIFFQLRRAFYFLETTLPGTCGSMKELRQRLWTNVFTHDAHLYARVLWKKMEDFSTILLGETGTGKGIAAAAIGRSGFIPFDEATGAFATSFVDAFLSINLSQFPESLVESELFGHKKGAFTGAVDSHRGLLERTSAHGAILLDEIGETSAPVQIKLLRVLQERTFSPVGAHEAVRFQGRVIAATHRSLDELRASGRFRDDFYYRLCSDVLELPSLRSRVAEDPSELDLLLGFIVRRTLGEDSTEVCERVRTAIERDLGRSYRWPGNVRELEQCVRRVILTSSYAAHGGGVASMAPSNPTESEDESARTVMERHCRALYLRHGTYEEVARRTGLDRRTVKRYVHER